MGVVLDGGQASGLLPALQALAALAVVAALVWLGRRALSGVRSGRAGSESMHVEARIGLDLKNALVIVRVGERRMLLATSERGPARLIAELAMWPLPGATPSEHQVQPGATPTEHPVQPTTTPSEHAIQPGATPSEHPVRPTTAAEERA